MFNDVLGTPTVLFDANASSPDSASAIDHPAFTQSPPAHSAGGFDRANDDASFVASPERVPAAGENPCDAASVEEYFEKFNAQQDARERASPSNSSTSTLVSDGGDAPGLIAGDAGTGDWISKGSSWDVTTTLLVDPQSSAAAALEYPVPGQSTITLPLSVSPGLYDDDTIAHGLAHLSEHLSGGDRSIHCSQSQSPVSGFSLDTLVNDHPTTTQPPSIPVLFGLRLDTPPLDAETEKLCAAYLALQGIRTSALTEDVNGLKGFDEGVEYGPESSSSQVSGSSATDAGGEPAAALTQLSFDFELGVGSGQHVEVQQASSSFIPDDPLPFREALEEYGATSPASTESTLVGPNGWPYDSVAYRRHQDLLPGDLGGAMKAMQVLQWVPTPPFFPSMPSGSHHRNNGEGRGRTPCVWQQEPQQRNSKGKARAAKRKETTDENSTNIIVVESESEVEERPIKRARRTPVSDKDVQYGVFCPHPSTSDSSKRCDDWLPRGADSLLNHIERFHGLPPALESGKIRCPLFKTVGSTMVCGQLQDLKNFAKHTKCKTHELQTRRLAQQGESSAPRIPLPRMECPYCPREFGSLRVDSVRRHIQKSCKVKPDNWEEEWPEKMNHILKLIRDA